MREPERMRENLKKIWELSRKNPRLQKNLRNSERMQKKNMTAYEKIRDPTKYDSIRENPPKFREDRRELVRIERIKFNRISKNPKESERIRKNPRDCKKRENTKIFKRMLN